MPGFRGYLAATRSVGVSLALTLPILILYNISLIVPANDSVNAMDLLSRIVGNRIGVYGLLGANTVLALVSVVVGVTLARMGRIRWWHWCVLLVEGALWAVLVAVSGHVANMGVDMAMPAASILRPNENYSLMQILTYSAGAGYWEELVFRLFLVGGPWAVARAISNYLGKGNLMPVLVAGLFLVISAFTFAALHYVGLEVRPDPWSYTFRVVSGLMFGLLFVFRGFSVAVFSHFMYDVIAFWMT